MPTWPVSLPQLPLSGSLSFQDEDNTLRGPADHGEPQRRRRFSAAVRSLTFDMVMTAAQFATFEAFYKTDLKAGVLRFDWIDPVTNTLKEFSFAAPYAVTHVAGHVFTLQLHLMRRAE